MESFSYQDYLDNFKYSRIIKFGKIKSIRPIFIQPEYIQLYSTKRLLKYIWLLFLLTPTIVFFILLFLSIYLQFISSNNKFNYETLLPQFSGFVAFFFAIIIPLTLLILIFISFQIKKSSEWMITKTKDNHLVISIRNENTRVHTHSYPNSILQELVIEQSDMKIPFVKDQLFQLRWYPPFFIESNNPTNFYFLTGKKDDLEIFKELFITWSEL